MPRDHNRLEITPIKGKSHLNSKDFPKPNIIHSSSLTTSLEIAYNNQTEAYKLSKIGKLEEAKEAFAKSIGIYTASLTQIDSKTQDASRIRNIRSDLVRDMKKVEQAINAEKTNNLFNVGFAKTAINSSKDEKEWDQFEEDDLVDEAEQQHILQKGNEKLQSDTKDFIIKDKNVKIPKITKKELTSGNVFLNVSKPQTNQLGKLPQSKILLEASIKNKDTTHYDNLDKVLQLANEDINKESSDNNLDSILSSAESAPNLEIKNNLSKFSPIKFKQSAESTKRKQRRSINEKETEEID